MHSTVRFRWLLAAWLIFFGAVAVAATEASPPPSPEDAPYWKAIAGLTEAFNNEDLESFQALLSPRLREQGPVPGMRAEDFMKFMGEAMALRGGIARFHDLKESSSDPPDSEYPARAVVFHLEDGTPGYFGIALDDEGRIDHLSLFIQPEICDQGRSCEKAIHPAGELPTDPGQ